MCRTFLNTCRKYLLCREIPFVQNWGAMKNGEWSDNWCLDGLTCMYTHHYPWMIDNISHPLCKAHFLLFNAETALLQRNVKHIYHYNQSTFARHQQFFVEILNVSSRMMVQNVMQFHNLEYKLRRLSLYIVENAWWACQSKR